MEGTPWLAAVTAVLAVAAVVVFNKLVAARNSCHNARGSIDANLKKRHDLVPNLVRVVRAHATHEQETLTAVAEARARAVAGLGSTASPQAEARLVASLHVLEARVEAYPELKASEAFARLSRTLTELEEQISAARRAFNAHVMAHNNLVQQFPTLLVARLTGFSEMAFFSVDPASSAAPRIRLVR